MRKKSIVSKPKRRKQPLPWRWQARVIIHSPGSRLEARRQSRAAVRSRYAAADQAWVDAISSQPSPTRGEKSENAAAV